MKRFHVQLALGLAALLIAPSLATAQSAPGAASARDSQPRRGFRDVTFDAARMAAPAPTWWAPRANGRSLPLEGARLPEVTAAPEPNQTHPPCVIRVIPIDPRDTPRMLIMPGDKSIDPKSVINLPPCQARR